MNRSQFLARKRNRKKVAAQRRLGECKRKFIAAAESTKTFAELLHPCVVALSQHREIHRQYDWVDGKEVCTLIPDKFIELRVTVRQGTTEAEIEELKKALAEQNFSGELLIVAEAANVSISTVEQKA